MLPVSNPCPDFEALKEVLLGEREPTRVCVAELGIDLEVMNNIAEKLINQKDFTTE